MTKDALHYLIETLQPNICQVTAIRQGEVVYNDTWNGYSKEESKSYLPYGLKK